jgi:hypothetical protein
MSNKDWERAKNLAMYHVYATDDELVEMGPSFTVLVLLGLTILGILYLCGVI